jgi:hypothetical protein
MIRNLLNNPFIQLDVEYLRPYLENTLKLTTEQIQSAKVEVNSGMSGTYVMVQYLTNDYHRVKNVAIPQNILTEYLRDKKIDDIIGND